MVELFIHYMKYGIYVYTIYLYLETYKQMWYHVWILRSIKIELQDILLHWVEFFQRLYWRFPKSILEAWSQSTSVYPLSLQTLLEILSASIHIYAHISLYFKSFISSQSSTIPGLFCLIFLANFIFKVKVFTAPMTTHTTLPSRMVFWGVSWQGDPLSPTTMSSWFIRNMLIRKKCWTSCEAVDSTTSGGFLHPKMVPKFASINSSTFGLNGIISNCAGVRKTNEGNHHFQYFWISLAPQLMAEIPYHWILSGY